MPVVNIKTGELVVPSAEETGAIVMLTQAIGALSIAVDEMPINEVVNLKAKVATVQTATKELGMSKEAQELAAEAVRRAEWALSRAIRRGQAEGTITTREGNPLHRPTVAEHKPTDFETEHTLRNIYPLAEADAETFEAAIAEAKREGDLSRANVVRKTKGIACGPAPRRVPRPPAERTLASIQSLAAKAARESQTLTPDQIRRVRAEAGHVTASLRQSIEALERLVNSLDPEETK